MAQHIRPPLLVGCLAVEVHRDGRRYFHTYHTTTPMSEKIHTTEGAVERMTTRNGNYHLGSAQINGLSLPPILYNPEDETVCSQGGKKVDLSLYRNIDLFTDEVWKFGPVGTAEAQEKSQLQTRRARALVQNANRS